MTHHILMGFDEQNDEMLEIIKSIEEEKIQGQGSISENKAFSS